MINKEVIRKLKDILEEVTEADDAVCYVTSDDADALKMAIKALEKETYEDCINRQAVINAIANTCFWLSGDDWNELMECINSIPPVTPQQKVGQWIDMSGGFYTV